MISAPKPQLLIPLAFFTVNSHALSLGELKVYSRINEPLNAQIQLIDKGSVNWDDVSVRNAHKNIYHKLNLQMPKAMKQIRFKLKKISARTAVIELSSKKVIREPFISFITDLHWRHGHINKAYNLLLDPPEIIQKAAYQHNKAQKSFPQTVTQTKISSAKPGHITPARQIKTRTITMHSAAVSHAGAKTYTTRRADTLWKISGQFRPDKNVTRQQMMQALFALNPDAFINSNINLLKTGVTLHIPTIAEIRGINDLKSIESVAKATRLRKNLPESRQMDKQLSGSQKVASERAVAKIDTANKTLPVNKNAARLNILPPVPVKSSASSANIDSGVAMQKMLDTSRQKIKSLDADKKALEARISALNMQMKHLDFQEKHLNKQLSTFKSPLPSTPRGDMQNLFRSENIQQTSKTISAVRTESTLSSVKQPPGSAVEKFIFNPFIALIAGSISLLLLIFSYLGIRQYKNKIQQQLSAEPALNEQSNKASSDQLNDDMNFLEYFENHINHQRENGLDNNPHEKKENIKLVRTNNPEIEITDTLQSGFHAENYRNLSWESTLHAADSDMPYDSDLPEFDDEPETGTTTKLRKHNQILSEINTYLAYGSYDRAEVLLKQLFINEPDNTSFIFKLLECYAKTDNKTEYTQLASSALTQLQADTSFKTWVENLYYETWDETLTPESADKDVSFNTPKRAIVN